MAMRDIGMITQWTKNRGKKLRHVVSADGARVLRNLYGARPGCTARYNDELLALKRAAALRTGHVRVRATVGACPRTMRARDYFLHGLVRSGRDEFLDLRTEPPPASGAVANPSESAPSGEAVEAVETVKAVEAVEAPCGARTGAPFQFTAGHAGYVYVVSATTDDLETYHYVGETGNLEDPLARVRQHFDPRTSALLKRVPPSKKVVSMEHVLTKTVRSGAGSDDEARAAEELDTCLRMMKAHGPTRVRGAQFLSPYGEPLSRDQQMMLRQRFNCPFA